MNVNVGVGGIHMRSSMLNHLKLHPAAAALKPPSEDFNSIEPVLLVFNGKPQSKSKMNFVFLVFDATGQVLVVADVHVQYGPSGRTGGWLGSAFYYV